MVTKRHTNLIQESVCGYLGERKHGAGMWSRIRETRKKKKRQERKKKRQKKTNKISIILNQYSNEYVRLSMIILTLTTNLAASCTQPIAALTAAPMIGRPARPTSSEAIAIGDPIPGVRVRAVSFYVRARAGPLWWEGTAFLHF